MSACTKECRNEIRTLQRRLEDQQLAYERLRVDYREELREYNLALENERKRLAEELRHVQRVRDRQVHEHEVVQKFLWDKVRGLEKELDDVRAQDNSSRSYQGSALRGKDIPRPEIPRHRSGMNAMGPGYVVGPIFRKSPVLNTVTDDYSRPLGAASALESNHESPPPSYYGSTTESGVRFDDRFSSRLS